VGHASRECPTKKGENMKKYLKVDRNEYIFLEILYMLDFLSFDDDIQKEINKIRKKVEDKVFLNFFENKNDILNEECILCYTFTEK